VSEYPSHVCSTHRNPNYDPECPRCNPVLGRLKAKLAAAKKRIGELVTWKNVHLDDATDLAAAAAERDEALTDLEATRVARDKFVAHACGYRDERDRLREEARRYGRHTLMCLWDPDDETDCDCGWQEIEDKMKMERTK